MPKIAYQGLPGCYSQQAIFTFFGEQCEDTAFPSFREVFQAVDQDDGEIQFGLIPIENCLGGTIHENYDLLSKHNLKIRAEFNLKISHCLLGHPDTQLEAVKKVISHPQALSQCQENCLALELKAEPYYDTAAGAKHLITNNLTDTAAIASEIAATQYGLKVLKTNFGDQDSCYTRFLLISRIDQGIETLPVRVATDTNSSGEIKTSIVISLTDSVGALVKILNIFNLYGINLTRIESRPETDRLELTEWTNAGVSKTITPFQYKFYLDFITTPDPQQKLINKVMDLITDQVVYQKILGSYASNNQIYQIKKRLRVGIVGFGKFGQFLARKIMEQHEVLVTSKTDYFHLCHEMGINFYNCPKVFLRQRLDVLIISVSITAFGQVLTNLSRLPDFRNLLVVDVLSVKGFPKNQLLKNVPNNCDILTTHPMFGPESCPTNDWSDQPFVYETLRIQNQERYQHFMKTFQECRLIRLDAESHDQYAAKSQFITHVIGQILKELDVKETPIDTKSYQLLRQVGKIVGGDSMDLFKGLSTYNRYTQPEFKKLLEIVERLKGIVMKGSGHNNS